jgi:tetratricopeptide (TPR) repeat protein/transcriptional regulator with XRE-family HTH domain
MPEIESFSEALNRLIGKDETRSRYSIEDLASFAGVAKSTFANWIYGNLKKGPRHWQPLARLAGKLHFSEDEVDKLLSSANYPPVAKLWDQSTEQEDIAILSAWPRPSAPFRADDDLYYFIGRAEEIDFIEKWLSQSQFTGPLRIAGMPGAGKTVLAAHIAKKVRPDFPDGVLWVDMANADLMTTLGEFASDLGHDLSRYRGLSSRSRAFKDILEGKRALVIIDGAEAKHDIGVFLPIAPSSTAVIVTTRYRDIGVTLIAHPLNVEPFSQHEALALFAKILGNVKVAAEELSFIELAAFFGHLPIALDIAARQIKKWHDLTVGKFLAELQEERDGAHLENLTDSERSVRALFETSYRQLTSSQKLFFLALGAFSGRDFNVDAAAYVADRTVAQSRRMLIELRDMSLLQESQTDRFRLHTLLQAFVKSIHKGPVEIRRMVEFFARYAVQHKTNVAATISELPNMRAALDISREEGLEIAVLQITPAIARYLVIDGQFDDAQTFLDYALPLALVSGNPSAVRDTYEALGLNAAYQADFDTAEQYFQAGLAAAQKDGFEEGICDFLQNLSTVKKYQGKLKESGTLLREGLAIARKIGYQVRIAPMISNLASIETDLGNWPEAREYLEQSLELERRSSHPVNLPNILANLAATEIELKEFENAEEHLREALGSARDSGNSEALIRVMRNFGELNGRMRQDNAADDFFQQALDAARRSGNKPLLFGILIDWADNLLDRTELQRAAERYEEVRNGASEEDFPAFVADQKFGRARIAHAVGDLEEACRLGHESLIIYRRINNVRAKDVEEWLANLPCQDYISDVTIPGQGN